LTIVNSLQDYIIGLQHIGHLVDDLDSAIASFRRVYGVDEASVRRVPERPDGNEPTLFAFITVANTEFEIIQPQSSEARAELAGSSRAGAGLNHVAWRVRDIEDCLATLAAHGVRPGHVTPKGVIDTGRSKIVYLDPADTDGMLMELVEVAG
jgi:methylmalonyl-CoA epimerase